MAKKVAEAAGIRSEAVEAKTGKSWDEWFAILDKAGANQWTHKDIAKYIYAEWDCPSWWGQMITVGFEQERGLRVKNQLCSGEFSTSASKTFAVSVSDMFKHWSDAKLRKRWLPDSEKIVIRKANTDKSMRITWPDETLVEINFTAKGDAKSQAAVQHRKLEGDKDVARLKAYWSEALGKLNALLCESSQKPPAPAAKKKPASRKTTR